MLAGSVDIGTMCGVGFYLRKSFGSGPLRVNLSRSGLGFSFGVKGARVGSGPRGSYLHAGREGLYYRKSLSGRRSSSSKPGVAGGVAPVVLSGPAPIFSAFYASSRRLSRLGRLVPVSLLVGFAALFVAPWLAALSLSAAAFGSLVLRRRWRRLAETVPPASVDVTGSLLGVGGSFDPEDRRLALTGVSALEPVGEAFSCDVGVLRVAGTEVWLFSAAAASGVRLPDPMTTEVLLEAVPAGFVSVGKTFLHRNTDGGPDRRFSRNPEMFVVRARIYELASGVFLLSPEPLTG